jgi:hypothetical protein
MATKRPSGGKPVDRSSSPKKAEDGSKKVSDPTVDELKELVKTYAYIAMDEALLDFFGDPDEGLEFSEEFVTRLLASRDAVRHGKEGLLTLEEVEERHK